MVIDFEICVIMQRVDNDSVISVKPQPCVDVMDFIPRSEAIGTLKKVELYLNFVDFLRF